MEIKNAVIEYATIEIEDHGILSAMLGLGDGTGVQGFGGYSLDGTRLNACGVFVRRCLEVAGVSRWDQLKGRTVRLRREDRNGAIVAIGHIVNDDWFDPAAAFAALKESVG